jgi:hypothetical protein
VVGVGYDVELAVHDHGLASADVTGSHCLNSSILLVKK